jgi:hypothetical protein
MSMSVHVKWYVCDFVCALSNVCVYCVTVLRNVCVLCVYVFVSLQYNIVCQPAALYCTALHSRVENDTKVFIRGYKMDEMIIGVTVRGSGERG